MTEPRYLVAWQVNAIDFSEVVFAATAHEAERLAYGNAERAVEFDSYSPGPVPVSALVEAGWWHACGHCNHEVHEGGCDACRDEAPEILGPIILDWAVYCSPACREAIELQREEWRQDETGARAEVLRRWPGVVIDWVTHGGGEVLFTAPGMKGVAAWKLGADTLTIEQRDVAAWHAFADSVGADRWADDGGPEAARAAGGGA